MSATPLVAPVIHGNGDRPENLIVNLEDVWDALQAARGKLRQAGPNARNYNGPEHYDAAVEQQRRRMRLIDVLQGELEAEITAISAQAGNKSPAVAFSD